MSNFEKFVLSALALVPTVIDAIKRWASGDEPDPESPVDQEVRRILGPAEERLKRAIERAKGQGP